ncbi:MAG: Rrf2 family transcriptional regulator [Saprospiraceae bacterium]|nr:Rrf2 family transcriptional regulator [Saprospiraceae bacterium]
MFSKSCKYAIRAVLYLSIHSGEDKMIGVDVISDELDVPKHFLAKLLQQLSRARLISSMKGRSGGFFLSEKDLESNLLLVIEAIDGPGTFTDCVLGLKTCSDKNPCPYHFKITDFRSKFYAQLKEETVGEISTRIKEKNFKLKNIPL